MDAGSSSEALAVPALDPLRRSHYEPSIPKVPWPSTPGDRSIVCCYRGRLRQTFASSSSSRPVF